jgi:hypothetical protein
LSLVTPVAERPPRGACQRAPGPIRTEPNLERTIKPLRLNRHAPGLLAASVLCLATLGGCRFPTRPTPSPGTNPGTASTIQPTGTGAPAPSTTTLPTTTLPTTTLPTTTLPTTTRPTTTLPNRAGETTAQGRAAATKACELWADGRRKSAAEGAPDLDTAATQAASAARLDHRWKHLANDMIFISSLPVTGNTADDIDHARVAALVIGKTCGTLGVEVPT